MIIPFYSWVSHIHEGPQNFSKSSQIARYQDTLGLHSSPPSPGDREGLLERVWQGTANRSHADCLDPAQGLETHVTNIVQKGAVVQLPYELWEMV